MAAHPEHQLELFEGVAPATRPAHHGLPRPWHLSLRYEQGVLCGIGVLIAVAVLFAFGVERGKQLARTERPLLARTEAKPPVGAPTPAPVVPPATIAAPIVQPAAPSTSESRQKKSRATAPRYAVQVVTFSRAQLAKRAMDRLRAGGEAAFLVTRDGFTSVCLGPFSTRQLASQKVATLKPKFQDCFVRFL